MTENPFTAFVALAQADARLLTLKKDYTRTQQQLHQSQEEKKLLEQRLSDARQVLHDLRKDVDTKERALKEIDQTLIAKQRRLQEAASPKEYFSVQQELETLQQQKQETDDLLLDLWQRYEEQRVQYQELEKTTSLKVQYLHEQITAQEQAIVHLQASIEQQEHLREDKQHKIPLDWQDNYARMRSRVENPIVPAENGACTACFYVVNQQDMAALARHKILECKNCYRLLYSV